MLRSVVRSCTRSRMDGRHPAAVGSSRTGEERAHPWTSQIRSPRCAKGLPETYRQYLSLTCIKLGSVLLASNLSIAVSSATVSSSSGFSRTASLPFELARSRSSCEEGCFPGEMVKKARVLLAECVDYLVDPHLSRFRDFVIVAFL